MVRSVLIVLLLIVVVEEDEEVVAIDESYDFHSQPKDDHDVKMAAVSLCLCPFPLSSNLVRQQHHGMVVEAAGDADCGSVHAGMDSAAGSDGSCSDNGDEVKVVLHLVRSEEAHSCNVGGETASIHAANVSAVRACSVLH